MGMVLGGTMVLFLCVGFGSPYTLDAQDLFASIGQPVLSAEALYTRPFVTVLIAHLVAVAFRIRTQPDLRAPLSFRFKLISLAIFILISAGVYWGWVIFIPGWDLALTWIDLDGAWWWTEVIAFTALILSWILINTCLLACEGAWIRIMPDPEAKA